MTQLAAGYRLPADDGTDGNITSKVCPIKSVWRTFVVTGVRNALNFPPYIQCSNGTRVGDTEALCVLLKRMVYPNRLCDLRKTFDRSVVELCCIFNAALDHVYENFHGLLTDLDQWWLDADHLRAYSAAVSGRGAPLDRCLGFIDGTVRPICWPIVDQQEECTTATKGYMV
jgi:hypothetical protein